ncbi:MAG: dTDP-4-dehydrorhamnose reductase [Elusimicrobiaceae bacterium]|nr:dTDP-4-dehydrorhamnose reductase [Elusimicrobiaceae bacterium]
MKVLITGSKGQLARAFLERFERNGAEVSACDIDTLDIADPDETEQAVTAFRPSIIINCAAYNLVDKAEQEYDSARRANALGPRNLASAAKKINAQLIHYGTDYVFDGAHNVPYTETDRPRPLNNYGRTKLEGEELVLASGARALVLRSSWVYGQGRQNFIFKLSQWAKTQNELKITADETSVPTSVEDIADTTLKAIEHGLTGRWHLVNGGYCSRYEWAELSLKCLGLDVKISPAKLADFNMPAARPVFSAMTNAALCRELGVTIPHWSESAEKFAKALSRD